MSSSPNRTILPIAEAPNQVPPRLDVHEQGPSARPFSPVQVPPGAPNVLIVLLDDVGFGTASTFGGPVNTPCADSLAEGGVKYTRFHTTAFCAPTRQALLTGRNHHTSGMGILGEMATDAPGYNAVRPASVATVASILKENGYSTAAFGKMHQTPPWEAQPLGPFGRWPIGDGFEKFYGFLGAETHQYYPALYDGVTPVEPPKTPDEGYHLSEDLVDNAIDWMTLQKSLMPDKPFFMYMSFGASHAPLQVPEGWAEKYRGAFDHGWQRQRELTFARQLGMGVLPQGARLPNWLNDFPDWASLTDEQREAGCLLMELYAGMTEHTDHQVGRLVQALKDSGSYDNTLIFYLLGDNGAAVGGGLAGTTNEWMSINGYADTAENILASRHLLGGPDAYPQFPVGWAYAMNAPYQWVKQVASHYGGTRNGLIVSWPSGIKAGGDVRNQWHHVIDVVPTILEAAGIPEPRSVYGAEQKPIEGVSMMYSLLDAGAPERHETQYFEMLGNRAIYHKGWVAAAKHRTPWPTSTPQRALKDDIWELYDTISDPTEAVDLAAQLPDKLRYLQDIFLVEAAKYQVLPLDDRAFERMNPEISGRYELTAGRCSATYPGSTRRLPEGAVINVRNRSHVITAAVTVSDAGGSGVVVSQGGAFGGWSLYLLGGCLSYCNNVVGLYRQHVRSDIPITTGEHTIGMRFTYGGGGLGNGGLVELFIEDESVAREYIERTTPMSFSIGDMFNVGVDIGTMVTADYGRSNAFPGHVTSVRIETGGDGVAPKPVERLESALQSH